MDNWLIFQYPHKNDGVTEKANITPLLDLGASAAVGRQENPLAEYRA